MTPGVTLLNRLARRPRILWQVPWDWAWRTGQSRRAKSGSIWHISNAVSRGITNALMTADPQFFDENRMSGPQDSSFALHENIETVMRLMLPAQLLTKLKDQSSTERLRLVLDYFEVFSTLDMTRIDPSRQYSLQLRRLQLFRRATRRLVDQGYPSSSVQQLRPSTILWIMYLPLRYDLDDSTSHLLGIGLFRYGDTKKSMAVLIENMTAGQVLTTLRDSIVPMFGGQRGREFVVFEIARAMIELGQQSLARQFLAELDVETGDLQPKAEALKISEASVVVEASSKCNDMASLYDFLRETVGANYPQLLKDRPDLMLWTRFSLLHLASCLDSTHIQKIMSRKKFVGILTQKFFLRNLMIKSMTYDESQNRFASLLSQLFRNSEHMRAAAISDLDLELMPYLAVDASTLNALWATFRHSHLNVLQRYPQTLASFLISSIAFKQTFTCGEIAKLANRALIQSPSTIKEGIYMILSDHNMLSKMVSLFLWSQRKSSSPERFLRPGHIDTALLVRLICESARQPVIQALEESSRALRNVAREDSSGPALWYLIMAIIRSDLPQIPESLQKNIGVAISVRPLVEQLRYMALPKVSVEGIMVVVNERLKALNASKESSSVRDIETLENEMDVRFVRFALHCIEDKTVQSRDSETDTVNRGTNMTADRNKPDLLTGEFTSQVLHATEVLDSSTSPDLFRNLSPEASISPAVVNQIVPLLLRHNNYILAFQILHGLPEVPRTVFYSYLVKASWQFPTICSRMIHWLRKDRNILVPSSVIRRVIIGFANSNRLNCSTSNRYVVNMIRLLRARHEGPGPVVCQHIVTSLLNRAERTGSGSRQRLLWALDLARNENVPEEVVSTWAKQLEVMRQGRRGYWSSRYWYRTRMI